MWQELLQCWLIRLLGKRSLCAAQGLELVLPPRRGRGQQQGGKQKEGLCWLEKTARQALTETKRLVPGGGGGEGVPGG